MYLMGFLLLLRVLLGHAAFFFFPCGMLRCHLPGNYQPAVLAARPDADLATAANAWRRSPIQLAIVTTRLGGLEKSASTLRGLASCKSLYLCGGPVMATETKRRRNAAYSSHVAVCTMVDLGWLLICVPLLGNPFPSATWRGLKA